MFRRFSINFAILSIIIDFLIILGSLTLANWLRPVFSSFTFAADVYTTPPIPRVIYLAFTFVWISILLLQSVYDGRKNVHVVDEFTSLTIASLLAMVSMAGILYFSYRDISRLLFVMFVTFAYGGMLIWRALARLAFRWGIGTEPGRQIRKVLIAGAGPVGHRLESQIQQHHHVGLTLVGFLDDDLSKRSMEGHILGTLEQARTVVREYGVDDVVLALPNRAYRRISQMVIDLHDLPVKVWVIPDYFGLALHKAVVEEFAGLPMFDLRAPALNDYQRMTKRAFDLMVTLIVMPLALPIMGLIALGIHLEGPGPIIFRQKRVGENGKLFEMLKFRTMVPGAEKLLHKIERQDENGNVIHKFRDDPRVTRIGKILRHTSLDELPQLFNILRGDMSLVGPRPELPDLVDRYEPWQRKRFAVPQGITGWWQVNGRSDKPMHLNTEDDLYYVQHYSLLLDMYILVKTIAVVFKGKGAF